MSVDSCSICLDEFPPTSKSNSNSKSELCLLAKCHHVFHTACISRALSSQGKCPNCRVKATTKDICYIPDFLFNFSTTLLNAPLVALNPVPIQQPPDVSKHFALLHRDLHQKQKQCEQLILQNTEYEFQIEELEDETEKLRKINDDLEAQTSSSKMILVLELEASLAESTRREAQKVLQAKNLSTEVRSLETQLREKQQHLELTTAELSKVTGENALLSKKLLVFKSLDQLLPKPGNLDTPWAMVLDSIKDCISDQKEIEAIMKLVSATDAQQTAQTRAHAMKADKTKIKTELDTLRRERDRLKEEIEQFRTKEKKYLKHIEVLKEGVNDFGNNKRKLDHDPPVLQTRLNAKTVLVPALPSLLNSRRAKDSTLTLHSTKNRIADGMGGTKRYFPLFANPTTKPKQGGLDFWIKRD